MMFTRNAPMALAAAEAALLRTICEAEGWTTTPGQPGDDLMAGQLVWLGLAESAIGAGGRVQFRATAKGRRVNLAQR